MSSPIDTVAENKRSLRNTRIALLIIVIIFVADLIGSYGMYEENQQLKHQAKDYEDLKQRFDNVLEMLQYQNKRVLELEEANSALMEHAEPKSLNKAVKATPLPKLIEV